MPRSFCDFQIVLSRRITTLPRSRPPSPNWRTSPTSPYPVNLVFWVRFGALFMKYTKWIAYFWPPPLYPFRWNLHPPLSSVFSGNPIETLPLELAVLTRLVALRLGRNYVCNNPTKEVGGKHLLQISVTFSSLTSSAPLSQGPGARHTLHSQLPRSAHPCPFNWRPCGPALRSAHHPFWNFGVAQFAVPHTLA